MGGKLKASLTEPAGQPWSWLMLKVLALVDILMFCCQVFGEFVIGQEAVATKITREIRSLAKK